MESKVNPQPDDPHIRIAHSIHREMIRRKFTARQRNIIDFILTLSWGCGKPSAIIPRLKDFRLCGVGSNHIRKELLALSVANVIYWDGAMNAFQINKHFDCWQIEVVDDFEKKSMDKLINYNLEMKSPNLDKILPEMGSEFPKEEEMDIPESGTNFPKREPDFPKEEVRTSRNGKLKVPEMGSRKLIYPCRIKRFQRSKTSIKASIKKRTTTTTTTRARTPDEFSFGNIFNAYERNFIAGGKITQFDIDEFSTLFDDYGGEWLLQAMREAYRQGPDKRNLAYVHGVLKGYRSRGGPDAGGAKTQTESTKESYPTRSRQQQRSNRAAELRQRAEEGRRRDQG